MRLFKLEKKTALLVGVFLVLFLLAFVVQCRAADFTFNAGSAVLHGSTETIGMRVAWPRVIADSADIEVGMQLIGSSTFRGEQPSQAILVTQLVNGIGRFDLGLGTALLQNDDEYNSGKFCFALSARYRVMDRVTLEWMHVSNAGTHSPNIGRDMALASYRF